MVLEDAFAETGIKFAWIIFISYPALDVLIVELKMK